MRMRALLSGLFAAGLAQASTTVSADDLHVILHPIDEHIAVVTVDGRPDGTYDTILTETIEYTVYIRGDRPSDAIPGTSILSLALEGGESRIGTLTPNWKAYKLSMPYSHPGGRDPRTSCQVPLNGPWADPHYPEEYLKNGATYSYPGAYEVKAVVSWAVEGRPGGLTRVLGVRLPAKLVCLGLKRDRTKGPHRTTDPAPPLFSKTTFKIEPAGMVRDGNYMCPSQLKLYGYLEMGRKFQGKAIFVGPHYLSAITPLHFSSPGSRNLVATYPVKWTEIGGLTTTSDPKPKKQKLSFRFNISDKEGKLLKSIEKTADVRCRKIDITAPAGMSANPGN